MLKTITIIAALNSGVYAPFPSDEPCGDFANHWTELSKGEETFICADIEIENGSEDLIYLEETGNFYKLVTS